MRNLKSFQTATYNRCCVEEESSKIITENQVRTFSQMGRGGSQILKKLILLTNTLNFDKNISKFDKKTT